MLILLVGQGVTWTVGVKVIGFAGSFLSALHVDARGQEPENISIGDAERLIEVMRLKSLELNRIFGMDRRTPRRIDRDLWVAGRSLLRPEPALRRASLSPPARLPSLRPLPTMLRPLGTISWAVVSSMSTLTNPPSVTDEQVRALLEKYKCPVPFHEVRTRFLGNIGSPIVSPSPIKAVQDLWGGILPPFDTVDEENKLFGALGMGLWIRLSRHQERALPFRLSPLETTPSRASLAELALMRRQELDGFSEGLFGREEIIDLPQRAQRGLDELRQMRALFEAVAVLAADEAQLATDKGMETTLQHLCEATRNAEHEIHAVVLACSNARRQMLVRMLRSSPTLH